MIEKDSAFLSNLRVKNNNTLVIRNEYKLNVMATVIESVILEELDYIFVTVLMYALSKILLVQYVA